MFRSAEGLRGSSINQSGRETKKVKVFRPFFFWLCRNWVGGHEYFRGDKWCQVEESGEDVPRRIPAKPG